MKYKVAKLGYQNIIKHHRHVLGAAVIQMCTKVGTKKQSKLSHDNYIRFKCL